MAAVLKQAHSLRVCGNKECQMSPWVGGGLQARMSQSKACLMSGPLAQFGRDNMVSGSIIGGGLLGSQGLRSSEGCGVSEEQPTRESALTLYQA